MVERLDNWLVDKHEGFRRFGIPAKKASLAKQVARGDKLIFYISSGMSQFSDIREATADGVTNLGAGGAYDTGYPLSLSTKPIITLEQDRWVPLKDLAEDLSITRGKKDFRFVVRASIRRLSEDDGSRIVSAVRKALSQ
jgi:hypothetical protein